MIVDLNCNICLFYLQHCLPQVTGGGTQQVCALPRYDCDKQENGLRKVKIVYIYDIVRKIIKTKLTTEVRLY